MSQDIDIDNLAELARIEIDDEQADELKDSIADILEYVSSVEKIADDAAQEPAVGPVHNIMREDADPHDPDEYRDQLLTQAPETDNNHVVVPPIL